MQIQILKISICTTKKNCVSSHVPQKYLYVLETQIIVVVIIIIIIIIIINSCMFCVLINFDILSFKLPVVVQLACTQAEV